jgi:hypothetical protein
MLLVYFPDLLMISQNRGGGIEMDQRPCRLRVGSQHDLKSGSSKFLGRRFQMVANAEKSWPSRHGHLLLQRGEVLDPIEPESGESIVPKPLQGNSGKGAKGTRARRCSKRV